MNSLLGNNFDNSEYLTKVSDSLMSDLALTGLLSGIFRDVDIKSFLTHSAEDIKCRNEIISDLLQNQMVFENIEKLCNCINDLIDIRTKSISSFAILKEYYDNLKSTQYSIDSKINVLKSDGVKILASKISWILNNKFNPNFESSWSKYANSLDKIGSLTYKFTFDENMKLSSYSLIATP